MQYDEYGDPKLKSGKPAKSKVCKAHKSAHVFELKEKEEHSWITKSDSSNSTNPIYEKKEFCIVEYRCECGKKNVVIYDKGKEIPEVL